MVAGLAGCAHSPLSSQWPVAPGELSRAFNPLDADIPANARMSAIDTALSKLVAAAGNEATSASERDWGSGDVVTAGGLMAVIGGVAEKIGLVNTGAAVGLVGGTGRARYQYPIQRQAYRKAETALACIQTQVRLFNDDNRVLVLSAGSADEKTGATKAPTLAIDAVNRARRQLMADLDAVGSTPPTRQEIEALVDKQKQADQQPAPSTDQASATGAVTAAQAASVQRTAAAVALRSAMAASGVDASPQLRAWLKPMTSPIAFAAPALPAASAPENAAWLVDDARNIAKAYPIELTKCVL